MRDQDRSSDFSRSYGAILGGKPADLIGEIYPLKIRGLAEGTAATFNWASNLIVSLTFLTLVEKLGASSTFLLYAIASVASWLFAYFVPETKGRTLERIEAFWRTRHRAHRTAARISEGVAAVATALRAVFLVWNTAPS